jgi:hypothetical protein
VKVTDQFTVEMAERSEAKITSEGSRQIISTYVSWRMTALFAAFDNCLVISR